MLVCPKNMLVTSREGKGGGKRKKDSKVPRIK